MRTPSAIRQFVTYPTRAILLVVGVLLLASVAPLYAEPAAMQPANWFASADAASAVPRSGFLLPTLAVPATAAGPRLVVTEGAFRETLPVRVSPAPGQDQTPPKPQRSWFGRNWKWFVPVMAGVAFGVACAVSCFPAGG